MLDKNDENIFKLFLASINYAYNSCRPKIYSPILFLSGIKRKIFRDSDVTIPILILKFCDLKIDNKEKSYEILNKILKSQMNDTQNFHDQGGEVVWPIRNHG